MLYHQDKEGKDMLKISPVNYIRDLSNSGYWIAGISKRYVKSIRHVQQARATQELVWEPGSTQVDFGEADFNVNGACRRMKYLTVSFPYSNDGFTQVFGGETAECVCQGLPCLQPRAPEAARCESAGDALQERRLHCRAFRGRPCCATPSAAEGIHRLSL